VEHFTVTATSKSDPSKSYSSTVNLTQPQVTSVIILEEDAAIYKGGSMEFHAAVGGPKSPDQNVEWSVTGNSSKDTKFEGNKLTIAPDEQNKSWTIKATSHFDGEHSAAATVKLAYKIAVSPSTKGKIDPKCHDRLDEYAPEGGKITIAVEPEHYYKLKSLQYNNGSNPVSIDPNSRTFTMPASDITISAIFEELAIGDRGPGGGWVFYENTKNNDSWKYLECAPTDASSAVVWSTTGAHVGTDDGFGSGPQNASKYRPSLRTFPAAAAAASYQSNGLGGWYLPSKQELEAIRTQLKKNKDFRTSVQSNFYWSSSEEMSFMKEKRAYVIVLPEAAKGKNDGMGPKATSMYAVRPVRMF
jgi:hypothetical protein